MSDLPPPNEAQHADHDEEQHRQHEQRDGGAMRHIAGKDTDLEAFEAEDGSGVDRTAIGQQKNDREVRKREYDAEDQAHGDDREDHRKDDLIVAAPETGAIDRRRVDDVLRNGGDAGKKDDDRKRKETP